MNSIPQLELSTSRAPSVAATTQICKLAILTILVAWLYLPILSRLGQQWFDDPNYSHGFLVPAFAIWVLWHDRERLYSSVSKPSAWGLVLVLLGLVVLTVGVFGAELFLSRISLLVVIAGLVVGLAGWNHFRIVLFPWAVLLLMIPIPAIVLTQITFPLQILTSNLATVLLQFWGVPVLREGNIINLPALPLEVADACSGIRSLLSLLTLSIVYGFFAETRTTARVWLALASVPIAIGANCVRIVISGLLAQYWDPNRAQGFFHEFSGWLIFLISLAALAVVHRILRRAEVRLSDD